MNEEVIKVKNKYKKMKRIILIVLLAAILIYAGNLLIAALRIQRIFINNANIDLGNNYKHTVTDGNVQTITYHKDEITNVTYANGKSGLYTDGKEYYFVSYEEKEYIRRDDIKQFVASPTEKMSLFNYWGAFDDDYIHSLKNMIVTAFQANAKFDTEIIDEQKYEVINMQRFGYTLWINTANHFIEKENMQGQIVEQKIEKNVVTDEDIKAPWEIGFKLKK